MYATTDNFNSAPPRQSIQTVCNSKFYDQKNLYILVFSMYVTLIKEPHLKFKNNDFLLKIQSPQSWSAIT